jgi:uncharacterized membrane protein YgcG
MSRRESFDDVLDAAIDAIREGEPMDAALGRHPAHAQALRPLLETASAMDPARGYLPPTSRLGGNFTRVASALGRAQWERDQAQTRQPDTHTPWWRRRVAFASLSLPAGVFAFALLGVGGAAAATLAATTDLPEKIGEQVERVAPSWADGVIPGGEEPSGAAASATPTPINTGTPAPLTSPTAGDAAIDAAATPEDATVAPGPQPLSVAGTITNVRGNTFELVVGDATYKVQIDANTTVSGDIVEGASATVDGEVTGNDRLHATNVAATAPSAAPENTPPQSSPEPPGQGGPPVTPPGQGDKTPNGQDGPPATPPGQGPPEPTRTPGPPATPPGQGDDGGSGNGSGNGNSGGSGNGGGSGSGNGNGGGGDN